MPPRRVRAASLPRHCPRAEAPALPRAASLPPACRRDGAGHGLHPDLGYNYGVPPACRSSVQETAFCVCTRSSTHPCRHD